MQIYALDANGKIVPAKIASRFEKYKCPECLSPLKLRGGTFRKAHFYHIKSTNCKHKGKSFTHTRIQAELKKKISHKEIYLEHLFPEIKRIGDAVWIHKKLIFEIQCSPISPEEIKNRDEDYAKLGFTVVWLLHDKIFNRDRLTPAEKKLQQSPHYFVRLNLTGSPIFYDQYSLIHCNRRLKRSKKFPITLENVFFNHKQFPSHFPEERKKWGVNFKGDLYDYSHKPLSLKKKLFIRPLRTLYLTFFEKITS